MKEKADDNFRGVRTIANFLLILLLTTGVNTVAQTGTQTSRVRYAAGAADVVRDPSDVPPPIGNRTSAVVEVTLTAEEVIGTLDSSAGTTYRYWTFNGKVPGPMIRVKQGDTVEVTLRNAASSHMAHSVDFHAALGPGGGAAFSQTMPGQTKNFTFQATIPGLYVYHCGTPMIGEHIANGMYGLILVEPEAGLPAVDHEYYVMQGEIYTTAPKGKAGLQQFSGVKLLEEDPQYFVFNGAVDALTKSHAMSAKVGDTVRIYFGDAGPNATSSLHVVGEIFTKDYSLGTLTSPPLTGVQTASVPAGGAAILEFKASNPGQYNMMDHAMARMAKGLMATFQVSGPENATLMHAGGVDDPTSARVPGMSQADMASLNIAGPDTESAGTSMEDMSNSASEPPAPVSTFRKAGPRDHGDRPAGSPNEISPASVGLNGCLTLAHDGKAMLKLLRSSKIYRVEARPLLFSENANRLVHVTGYFGSVVESEDASVPSFVVDTVDKLAANCSVNLSDTAIRKALSKPAAGPRGTVGMNDMAFLPATIIINAGERVVWRNSSQTIHNVVDDAGKALNEVDVKLPPGGSPFDSGLLQPGQTFSRMFTAPGVYRYVCTLHEGMGMKGVVVVRPAPMLASSK